MLKTLNIIFASTLLFSAGQAFSLKGVSRTDLLNKDSITLGFSKKDKASIYIFAQPDCASCSLQLSYLAAAKNDLRDVDIVVVTEQNSAAVKDYLDGFSLKTSLVADLEGRIISSTGIKTIPSIAFVNKDGKIKGFYEGILDKTEVKNLSSLLIKGAELPILTNPGDIGSKFADLKNIPWSKNNVVVFYSSTCHFCNLELPHLIKYAESKKDVNFIIISVDEKALVEEQFKKAGSGDNFKFIENTYESDNLYFKYNVQGTPTNFLIDSLGVISWKSVGFDEKKSNPFIDGAIPLK